MKNRKGVALPVVLMVMLVLTILITALWSLVTSESRMASYQSRDTQAHYLGRSGVYAGLKLLQTSLNNSSYTDMTALISAMNTKKAGLPATNFSVDNAGTYTLEYQAIDSTQMKVISIGTTLGSSPSSEKVTLTLDLAFPASSETNPNEWVSGVNLIHSVTTVDSYKGKGVTLEGHPIRSPQGGHSPSTFQASSILFSDYGGLSFKQIPNSVDITFDSEIIYFQTGVTLNSTDDNVVFALSSDVTGNRPPSPSRLYYSDGTVGFENVNRYLAFINGLSFTGYYDRSSYYSGSPAVYNFTAGSRYGIVYFGDDVSEDSTILVTKGYYFFENGVDIHNPITSGQLIAIDSQDIIIKAIESLYKYSVGSSDAFMWSRE